MKNYVKPVVLENDEIFEGVYAASGAFDGGEPPVPGENPSTPEGGNPPTGEGEEGGICWTVEVTPEREDLAGSFKNFRMIANHPNDVLHISTASTVVVTFSDTIVEAYSEFPCSTDGGCTVTVTRTYHANAYNSGDNYNSLLQVRAATDAATKDLYVVSATIDCTKTPNVQGGWDG